jgi:dipeptidyl aminopeptidase/acylaminoacyl peptidase
LVATDLNLSSTDVTASVLESGAEAQEATIDAELVEVDVLSGKQTVLATTVGFERRGFYQIASVSPDRRWIAFLRQTGVQKLQNDIPLYGIDENNDPLLDRLYEVMVVDGEGASSPKVLQGSASTSMAPFRKAIVWSEDDGSLAVRSFNGDRTDSVQTWRACVLRTGTCQLLIAKSQSFRSYSGEAVWSKMALFVHGTFGALRSEETYPIPSMSLRDRLWRVDADRTVHLFCAQDQVNIDALEALPGSSDFVGLSNGDLWKIDRDGHLLQDLTPELKGGIVAVVDVGPALNAEYQVKVGTTTPHFYRFDLHALQLRPMDESWTTEGASPDKLASFPVRVFTYQTLGNETVKAKLIFPPDYKPGSRYPTVVIVYPKNIDEDVGDRTEGIDPEERGEVFASHGYVVLEPSMPHFRIIVEWQPPQRFTANWYKEVTNGVLPAIDELVEQGIADPACLGVFGESYGGYVVNALISQTDRFKAAVSLSGISDLISFYGSLRTDAKYGASYYHEPLAGTNLESAHRLDGPPWKEFANYWTQSPIAYADRINTPLMLIHGDMDPLPIGQAEELFVAMKRQNKRAEFVRYWGDRHCIASPANVLDMYTRIYAWFDEFLRPRNASISKAPGVE